MEKKSAYHKDTSWNFKDSVDQNNLQLHVEIENLKQRLLEREHHIVTMETNFLNEAQKFPNGELAALTEELLTWQEKYSRLHESYKKIQKVNQNLEDKLLRIVDKCETEKTSLTHEVNCLTQSLYESRCEILQLKEENERYRNDINLAIQLLQCKPSNFVSQRYENLSADLQQKVRMYVASKRRPSNGNNRPEIKTIKVPIPTFPPTAMVYSVNRESIEKEEASDEDKSPVDIVSAAIMAKVLEERERERLMTKHCTSCICPQQGSRTKTCNKETQTTESQKITIDSANRGSQGLVRYVDVMTSRGRQGASNILGLSPQVSKTKLPNISNGVLRVCDTDENSEAVTEHVELIRINDNNSQNDVDNRSSNFSVSENDSFKSNSKSMISHNNKLSHEKILLCLNKPNTENFVRPANREGRTFLSDAAAGSDMSAGGDRQKLAGKKLKERSGSDVLGPRPCSLRVQAGTSNILLDNATSYEPVLYTCRSTKKERKVSRKKENPTASVHTSRSRSASSSSSCDAVNPAETEI